MLPVSRSGSGVPLHLALRTLTSESAQARGSARSDPPRKAQGKMCPSRRTALRVGCLDERAKLTALRQCTFRARPADDLASIENHFRRAPQKRGIAIDGRRLWKNGIKPKCPRLCHRLRRKNEKCWPARLRNVRSCALRSLVHMAPQSARALNQ